MFHAKACQIESSIWILREQKFLADKCLNLAANFLIFPQIFDELFLNSQLIISTVILSQSPDNQSAHLIETLITTSVQSVVHFNVRYRVLESKVSSIQSNGNFVFSCAVRVVARLPVKVRISLLAAFY